MTEHIGHTKDCDNNRCRGNCTKVGLSDLSDLLSRMSAADVEAAKRFHETIHDDGTYDISIAMCERLVDFGLATKPDVDFYYETDLMLNLIDELER